MLNPTRLLPILLILLLAGCSSSDPTAAAAPDAASDSDTAPASDTAPDTATASDTATTSDTTADATPTPTPPPTPAARGWRELRAIIHLHSSHSHDACDGEPLDDAGKPKAHCIQRLRDALCAERIDVAMLTDHPSYMRDFGFPSLLLHNAQAGDELLQGPAGPYGNRIPCLGPDDGLEHTVLVTVGSEGAHIMPVAYDRHLDDKTLYSAEIGSERAGLFAKEAAAVHAVPLVTHSERDAVTVEGMLQPDIVGLDVYNFHANIIAVFSSAFDKLLEIEGFLGDGPDVPAGDGMLLAILDAAPTVTFERWDAVLLKRPFLGWAACDAHENVVLDGYCGPGGKLQKACDAMRDTYPNLVKALEAGGPIILSDGERLDAYARTFRWTTNRLLVPAGDALVPESPREALRAGRAYVAFDIFGEPKGFDVVARTASGKLLEMGQSAEAGDPATTLLVTVPSVTPARHAIFEAADAAKARVETRILRIDGSGTHEVRTAGTGGDETLLLAEPMEPGGVYRVEVHIKPLHLAGALRARSDLAERTYPWLIGNAIRNLPSP